MRVLVVVITGPIASGKSTLGRAVAEEFKAVGTQAAVIDLDLMYEMLDPSRAAKTDETKWTQARRVTARRCSWRELWSLSKATS
jgi:adenylylsulfate kinase-like enzyme